MNIVYAADLIGDVPNRSIFLAGPSPRRETDYNWRPEALEILANLQFGGSVFVPLAPDDKWLRDYAAQVEWELAHLDGATVIAFWVPRDLRTLPGFTTNVEFGMYAKSGKIVLGFPRGTPHSKYLAYVATKNHVSVYHSLEETMKGAMELVINRLG